MKILIIGEYSGFSKNLNSAFKQLGHESLVISWGDSFKKIKQDEGNYNINISNYRFGNQQLRGTCRIRSFFSSFLLNYRIYKLKKLEKWDVVLVINPAFLKLRFEFWKPYFSKSMILGLLKNPSNVYLTLCGNDIVYNSNLKNYRKKNEAETQILSLPNIRDRKLYHYYSSFIEKVIPVMYDYAEAYRTHQLGQRFHLFSTIPLPISLDTIKPSNKLGEKIIVFHGINRLSKGTEIIMKAMDRIANDFPDKVTVISKGHMPFNEYLQLMQLVNIIIDQCYGFSYGMNAIYGMAMGKVVFSNNEPENFQEFGCSDIPVVNIIPDVEFIYNKIKLFLLNPDLILDYSQRSRKYVEDFHSATTVAEKYIKEFEKNM